MNPCPFTPPVWRLPKRALSTVVVWTAVAGGLLVLAPERAEAQTARDILARALEANTSRLAGIENLTIRQDVMGMSMVTYLEKEMVDGYPVLWPRQVGAMGMEMEDDSWEFLTNPRDLYGRSAEHWTLEGRGSVDGRATWRLSIEGKDIPGMDEDPWDDDDALFEAGRMIMDLDQERLVPLRIEIDGLQGTETGGTVPMSMVMSFSDYREVQGYLHPFLMVMEMTMGEGADPAELAEAREQWAEFQRQMEQMPPEQRRMMEEMMGDQIRMFEGMVSGDPVRSEIRVTELLVNRGPPER
jgi:hypothetical protein